MNSHTRKTLEAIQRNPAPRDIEWKNFITLWEAIADEVKQESGDRLAVNMNGHREVFHRPHDGLVGIEDVHRARAFLQKKPELKGTGSAYAVAIDAKGARLFQFDLQTTTVVDEIKHTRDGDARAHHLRTVERKTGLDDEADLKGFYDELAKELRTAFEGAGFVVLGHGAGKADVAAQFVERLQKEAKDVAERVIKIVDIDLSAANDGDLENAVLAATGQ